MNTEPEARHVRVHRLRIKSYLDSAILFSAAFISVPEMLADGSEDSLWKADPT